MTSQGWVVIAGPNAARRAELAAAMVDRPDWRQCVFNGPAAVFTQSQCQYATPPGTADAGVLGTVFTRHGTSYHQGTLEDAAWRNLCCGSIGQFFERCWGGFVALSSSAESLQVSRDPSAAMPCYYAHASGVVLVGSSIAHLIAAGLRKPTIAMDQLARSLFRADLSSQETAFVGVSELLPGDCLQIDRDGLHIRHVWSPWDHVAIDETIGFLRHAEQLRDAVENCVAAWGTTAHRTLVGVSGGLDSSIVATCLASKTPRPVCVTVSTADAEGDERVHAHRICDHLKLALQEADYDLDDIDIERPARPDLPRPTGRMIAQAYNAAVTRVAHGNGADAFFTGNGGDNVFAFSQSAGAIADRLLHDGPWIGAWQSARDICQLTGCSLIQAWRSALRLATGPHSYHWKPDPGFLHPDVLRKLDREPLMHPWLDAPKGALPGKAAHIAALLRIQRHLEDTGQLSAVRVINPLMSQPIIETCLAIPSWMWCRGGRNRSVARHAFRNVMPPSITDRVSKGGPSGFGTRILDTFHDRIMGRLLDGHLAAGGIVDRAALERRLRDERPDWGTEQVRVLELLEAEAWIDHWR